MITRHVHRVLIGTVQHLQHGDENQTLCGERIVAAFEPPVIATSCRLCIDLLQELLVDKKEK